MVLPSWLYALTDFTSPHFRQQWPDLLRSECGAASIEACSQWLWTESPSHGGQLHCGRGTPVNHTYYTETIG